jgi:sialate O-acetylesterase
MTQAEPKLPTIFGDHMVLQAGMKLPVWGWAKPGEAITVTAGVSTAKTVTAADGTWRVTLDPLAASDQPIELTVEGASKITLRDVLVGEVWLASGQSNMEFQLGPAKVAPGRAHNMEEEIPKADHPQLRLFIVKKKIAFDPTPDCEGKWELCTPKTASDFSAVAYFFGRDLHQSHKVPVGMIGSYWGATPAQAWTSLEVLKSHPETTEHATAFEQLKATPAPRRKKYDQHLATSLYNGMIAPIIPFAMRGVIWYQGEGNAANPVEYQTLFPAMIADWRVRWGQGDFPFLWVQLANFRARPTEPPQTTDGWPGLREAQAMTLKLPNTAQAVAIDIGDANDIHPRDKSDVAHRLLLAARRVAYGEDLVYAGPTYESHQVDGNKVRIKFKHVVARLTIAAAPSTRPSVPPAAPANSLQGFAIAGEDKNFVWADATIDGDHVVVSSPRVSHPVAVRYGWANNPDVNLYNREGLPAVPFRTDGWVRETARKP